MSRCLTHTVPTLWARVWLPDLAAELRRELGFTERDQHAEIRPDGPPCSFLDDSRQPEAQGQRGRVEVADGERRLAGTTRDPPLAETEEAGPHGRTAADR